MTATPKRDALAAWIKDSPSTYRGTKLGTVITPENVTAVVDAILGHPTAVIAALVEAGAIESVEATIDGDPEWLYRVVAGEDR